MLDSISDDAFARYVKQTGMATPGQIDEARKLAPLPLAEALVNQGVITPLQRDTVEKKLEAQREGVGELAGCRLLKKIGEGGMGAVYLAEDPARKRKVAIKVLPKKHASDAEFVQRFRREIEAATQLDHPNIVRAYTAGEERGHHFFVMEYCEGESLRKRIDRLKFLPAIDACRMILQVAQGLKHAHDRGIIHRDVKPENLMVTSGGAVKILDLGLAKNLDDTNASFRTATGSALGTPHYISPEQARGDKSVDGRSDLYSLGATFYHLITGQVPFNGSSIFEIIQKHLMEQLADPRDIRPEIPPTVVQVVRRMLAKKPDDRHRDCAELIGDLERLLANEAPLTQPLDAALSSLALPRGSAPTPSSRRTPVVLAGSAAAVVLIGIVAWAAWPDPTPAAKPPPTKVVAKKDPPKVDTPEPEPAKPDLPKPEPPKPEPERKPEPEVPKPEPPKPDVPKPESPKPEPEPPKVEPPPPPPKPTKAGVPEAATLAAAEKALKERYKDDYAKTAASDNAMTAKKLLALEPPEEPAANYARLLASRNFAALGGDPATALMAVDRLGESFLIDPLLLKTEALTACVSRTTDGATAIATAAFALLEEAIRGDRYEPATRLAAKAKAVVEPLKNDELKATAAARDKQVAALKKDFDAISAYAKTLPEKPDDPVSNAHLGRFTCFAKDDWERGLPMLAKGSDVGLRGLAEKELSKPEDPGIQRDLCEGWLALAEKEKDKTRKDNLTERAQMWFAQVEQKLLPADRTRIASRFDKLGPKTAKAPAPKPMVAAPTPLQGSWLNLMPIVDVSRHSVNGAWQRTAEGLVSPATGENFGPGSARIWIPWSPPDEYEVILNVERLQGQEDLVIGLMHRGRPFAVAVDGWGGQSGGGIYNARTGQWQRSPTAPPRAIPNNKVTRIGLFVRGGGFNMTVDARPYLQIADMSIAGMPDSLRCLGQNDGLVVGSVRSVYRISKIEFQPMAGGQGKVLK